MQERNVLITYEAINDIVDAEEYIRYSFGEERAIEYRNDIRNEIMSLSTNALMYRNSGFKYKQDIIYKKPFSPAILFWIVRNDGVHVLRVPREEYNWQRYFRTHQFHEYEYPDSEFSF